MEGRKEGRNQTFVGRVFYGGVWERLSELNEVRK